MSSTTDSEATIIAFVGAIRPALYYIIVTTAFSACLFTFFVVLIALSTKESRRRLAFRLNALAIRHVITMGVLIGWAAVEPILSPFSQVPAGVLISLVIFLFYSPLLYDSILLTRLFALYPLGSTPAATLVKIFAFPFCIKCARVAVITIAIYSYTRSGMTSEAVLQDETTDWFRDPYMTSEWTMQIADNLYSVSFFLYNLHVRTSSIKRAGGIADRIRRIFYISVANFIFPVVFNVAQIIFITTDRSPTNGAVLLLIDSYVTVMGVMCATLWSSGSEWVRTHNEPSPERMLNSRKPNFGRDHVAGGESGSSVVSVGKGFFTHGTMGLDTGMGAKQLTTPEKENRYILV
ncbi:hypothetical protein BKA82DRAFT_727032 [Pisolithus tinctorius]|uniref:G-protein coupled receptors family 1 profile domain-containing protein n=1 Tax=Pisolithus tinctorius Marx 270 TaxID=870435 RepID=A0A0C3P2L5_PISTI|nr:hypothetical protein BKA82DRAFT_727032 [Pisolithus tinctorius]KIO01544.1 hypothetical protein M404DRAFT_727032 [Pisolithus tinctorius Marx 270]